MGFERVEATEVANLALSIGFLQSEVLAGSAVGGTDSDFAEVNGREFKRVITVVI